MDPLTPFITFLPLHVLVTVHLSTYATNPTPTTIRGNNSLFILLKYLQHLGQDLPPCLVYNGIQQPVLLARVNCCLHYERRLILDILTELLHEKLNLQVRGTPDKGRDQLLAMVRADDGGKPTRHVVEQQSTYPHIDSIDQLDYKFRLIRLEQEVLSI